jgi:hypothetical protein
VKVTLQPVIKHAQGKMGNMVLRLAHRRDGDNEVSRHILCEIECNAMGTSPAFKERSSLCAVGNRRTQRACGRENGYKRAQASVRHDSLRLFKVNNLFQKDEADVP